MKNYYCFTTTKNANAVRILVIFFSLAVSSCSEISDLFLSPTQKVNKAFLPEAEVRMAEEDIRSLLQEDSDQLNDFNKKYKSRLELRALNCTKGIGIGIFDSISKIKKLPIDRDCLKIQDAELSQYIGVRQLAFLISKPPLRPKLPLGVPFQTPTINTVNELFLAIEAYPASESGVVVLKSNYGEYASIEIPGGKKISTLANKLLDARDYAFLSPNGRVFAVVMNAGVAFYNTETGTKLWVSNDINHFYAWLPELSMALVRKSNDNRLSYIDFQNITIKQYPVNLLNQNWALQFSPSQILIGHHNSFSLINNERTPEGISASIIKEYRIEKSQGITSKPPTLMLNGNAIFYISVRDFAKFDLQNGKESKWETRRFISNHYAKLSETTVLVHAWNKNGALTIPLVINISDLTIAPVENKEGFDHGGGLYELIGRNGFMIGDKYPWFGDELKLGSPVSLDYWLSLAILESNTPVP